MEVSCRTRFVSGTQAIYTIHSVIIICVCGDYSLAKPEHFLDQYY